VPKAAGRQKRDSKMPHLAATPPTRSATDKGHCEVLALLVSAYWPNQRFELFHLDKWIANYLPPGVRKNLKKLLKAAKKRLESLGIHVIVARLTPKGCCRRPSRLGFVWFRRANLFAF